MRTEHFGGRWCWCKPMVGIVLGGDIAVVHGTSSGKRRDVLRVERSMTV